jgi:hypothetical protein
VILPLLSGGTSMLYVPSPEQVNAYCPFISTMAHTGAPLYVTLPLAGTHPSLASVAFPGLKTMIPTTHPMSTQLALFIFPPVPSGRLGHVMMGPQLPVFSRVGLCPHQTDNQLTLSMPPVAVNLLRVMILFTFQENLQVW